MKIAVLHHGAAEQWKLLKAKQEAMKITKIELAPEDDIANDEIENFVVEIKKEVQKPLATLSDIFSKIEGIKL